MLTLIVAMSENHVIGRDGGLPWHLPADLAHFKRVTAGHAVIMGRRTFESIGRPLPGRYNIVITRNPDYTVDGATVARSLDEAITAARDMDQSAEQEVFILGGEAVYRQALPRAERIYLTLVHAHVDGDTRFPALVPDEWRLVEEWTRPADDRNAYAMTFRRLERRAAPRPT